MDLIERIRSLAFKQNLNIKNLEEMAGLGNGTMRRWGTSPPSADKLLKIANILNTTCEYLMTGTSSFATASSEDIEWLSLIHQLPKEAQYEFRGELKGYIKRLNEESVAADAPSLKKTGTDKLGK